VATVRYLVKDVDSAITFYSALGFELADRWGPSFAAMKLGDLTLWVSGPGTSASKPLPGGRQVLCEVPSGNPIELFEARK
jgi:catechol 2,3-dioxygenase-like lactoylglutathione lyase family enzyme